MNERLAQQLQQETAELERGRVPAFATVFGAAQEQVDRRRARRRYAMVAAAASVVLALVLVLQGDRQPDWQYVDPALIVTTTSWEAPSDVLLPQRSVNVFEDIPVLIEGTEIDGGALL